MISNVREKIRHSDLGEYKEGKKIKRESVREGQGREDMKSGGESRQRGFY